MKKLAPSVQRRILQLTPATLLDRWSRSHPRFVIRLLCHLLNEKNINIEERFLAPRLIAPVPVAKKMSQLSELSILNLLRQDESLWQFYAPNPHGGIIINLKVLPYILLEIMFDLGGKEGREKVVQVIAKCRTTIGGAKQLDILRNFKTDTVLDLFEMLPPMEVNMILKNPGCEVELAAFWLNHWDLRMQRMEQPSKSAFWLGQIPGKRAFQIEQLMRQLEFRKKYEPVGNIYDYKNEWIEFVES
jgi:hypothetical protein